MTDHGTYTHTLTFAADAFLLPLVSHTTTAISLPLPLPKKQKNTHTLKKKQLVDDLVNATNSYRSLKIRVTKQGQEIEAWQTKVRPFFSCRGVHASPLHRVHYTLCSSGARHRRRRTFLPTSLLRAFSDA